MRGDMARLRVHDHMLGRRCMCILRAPRLPRRIEDRGAAEEQILMRPEGKSGRLAEVDRVFRLYLSRDRIDPRHRPVRTRTVSRTVHLRYR